MDFSVIAAAVSSINGAIDLGKNALGLSNAAEAKKVVVAMNEKLFDAQQRLFELSSTLNTLQQEKFQSAQELRELKEALAERGRYTLVAISDGQFAYRVNPTPALGGTGDPGLTEPDHYVCQKCFDGPGKDKVVLQRRGMLGGGRYLECPGCKVTFAWPQ